MPRQILPIMRTSISLFLSFCVTLFGTLAILLSVVLSTICSAGYMLDSYEKSGFFERITDEIRMQYIDIGIPGGISEKFFEKAIDENRLHMDITSIVTASFMGESYSIDAKEQRTFLYNQLLEYAENEKGLTLTDELIENLSHLTDLCIDVYTDSVSNPFIMQIGNLSNQYSSYIWLGLAVIGIMMLACIIFLFCLHRRKDVPLRYLQFSTLSIGIILLVPSAAAMLNGFMDRINISVPSLFYFVNTYITNIVKVFLYGGIGIGVIGTGLLAGICYFVHKHYRKT